MTWALQKKKTPKRIREGKGRIGTNPSQIDQVWSLFCRIISPCWNELCIVMGRMYVPGTSIVVDK